MNGAMDMFATAREQCAHSVRQVRGAVRTRWTELVESRLPDRLGEFARGSVPDAEVVRAWVDLREHPELKWVPPMWRQQPGTAPMPIDVDRVVVRAVERNLVVEIVTSDKHGMRVRVSTSPLQDRHVGDGVDPTTPAVAADPTFNATAPTFEQAIVKLRNAVVHEYGPAPVPAEGRRALPGSVTSAGKLAGKAAEKASRPLHLAR